MPLILKFSKVLIPEKGEKSETKPIYVNIDHLLFFQRYEDWGGTYLFISGSEHLKDKILVQEDEITVDRMIREKMAES